MGFTLAVNCLRNARNIHAIIPWWDILTNGKARRLQSANDFFLSLLKSTGIEGLSWILYVSVTMVVTQFCLVSICFFHLSRQFPSLGLNGVKETFTLNQKYNLGLISNPASLQCCWWESIEGPCWTETLLVKLSTGRWKRSICWLHGEESVYTFKRNTQRRPRRALSHLTPVRFKTDRCFQLFWLVRCLPS